MNIYSTLEFFQASSFLLKKMDDWTNKEEEEEDGIFHYTLIYRRFL